MNQIDIPDYQYYLGCIAKRMISLTSIVKKFVFQSEISTYLLILFSKKQKFHRVKELFKSNQTRYGVSHVYLEGKPERMFGRACLQKKFLYNTETYEFRD